jgi:hypothetical protein
MLLVATASLASFVIFESRSEDHLLAGSLAGAPSNFRAYSNFPKPEIQDREVYFYNIGHSIEEARKADVVILGHSSVLYALDDDQIRAFDTLHGVRIFNMASAGNASGDFIRAVIKRWDIHPKLWVINADDEPVSFFNPGVDDYGATGVSSAPEIVKTSLIIGVLRAYRRNVRWLLGDQVARLPLGLRQRFFPSFMSRFQTWRSTETGDWVFPEVGSYYDQVNSRLRPPAKSCPLAAKEIADARGFLDDIGGAVVFTLVPYVRWCPQHTDELAAALGIEAIIPPTTDYTSPDGRHLDRTGAKAFTSWFLDALARTAEFKKIETQDDVLRAATHPGRSRQK